MGNLYLEGVSAFVIESNDIEGIKTTTEEEVMATLAFIELDTLRIADVSNLVNIYQPGAHLRLHPGMDVYVDNHCPPPGGPHVGEELKGLLSICSLKSCNPHKFHHAYETLHPYMDGNGRSGRAIWLRQMIKKNDQMWHLGFKHAWYYQSLAAGR